MCAAALPAERRADVISRERLPFDDQGPYACLQKIKRSGRAGRAASNNDYLSFFHFLRKSAGERTAFSEPQHFQTFDHSGSISKEPRSL
jgi:hypothetical protein